MKKYVLIIDSLIFYREALAQYLQGLAGDNLIFETASILDDNTTNFYHISYIIYRHEADIGTGKNQLSHARFIHLPDVSNDVTTLAQLLPVGLDNAVFHARDDVLQGEAVLDHLSRRERDVVDYLINGAPNQDIADGLGIRLPTVKLHIRKICDKLKANNRTQAALIAYAARHGMLWHENSP